MKKLLAVLSALALFAALSLAGCAPADETEYFFVMNTVGYLTVPAKDRDVLKTVSDRLTELDALFSVTNPESDISRINGSGGKATEVSDDTAQLITRAVEINKTLPAFDISLYAVSRLWDFGGTPRLPSADEISVALGSTGLDKVAVSGRTVTVSGGIMLDLGAIAKGYASDEVARILNENGVTRAILSLGGNVCAVGAKADGSAFRVGIRLPYSQSGEIVGTVTGGGRFYVTSGCYERYFTENGVEYCHILDPGTGYSAKSGLLSVTVICDDGTLADALSTAFFVMGAEASLDYIAKTGVCEAVFVKADRTVLATEGALKTLSVTAEGYRLAGQQ